MITRRAFKAEDVLALGVTVEPLADMFWTLSYANSFAWLVDGEIAMCAGIARLWSGVAEGWALVREDLKDRFPRDWKPLMREVKRFLLEEQIPSLKLHRFHMLARMDIKGSHALAQFLGGAPESILRGYGPAPGAADFMMYVISVRSEPSPTS